MKRTAIALLPALCMFFLATLRAEVSAVKPNIILIFTDDHGYADLSCQGYAKDVRTPHIDRLAKEGVRFTDGYVTAPQCCPSRAGLLTGRDQNRFGFVSNGKGPLPLEEKTLADHLRSAAYTTGMVGKWHLEPNHSDTAFLAKHKLKGPRIPPAFQIPYLPQSRGFSEIFFGSINRYSATYDLDGGHSVKVRQIRTAGDRIDRQSDAAVRFIGLHHDKPFFLYLAYFAPHVPLASSENYLKRFPGVMPERRRYALAMLSALDDGVGRILAELERRGIDDKTLIFFIGDNGAPLKLTMGDDPVHLDGAYWNGSKNTPLNGEKGMLSEGGIRVPWLMRWKGRIPAGQVIDTPVTTLDVAATSTAAAGIARPTAFEGENLLPLAAENKPLAKRTLRWRFWSQAAARRGDWKLLKLGDRKTFLFNLAQDVGEKNDLAAKHPEIVSELEQDLRQWTLGLKPAGLPTGNGNAQEIRFYSHFFGLPEP